jgi:hypothetical protein
MKTRLSSLITKDSKIAEIIKSITKEEINK